MKNLLFLDLEVKAGPRTNNCLQNWWNRESQFTREEIH